MRLALYPGERVGLRAGGRGDGRRAPRPTRFLAACTVEVRYDGFACDGYVLGARPRDRRGRRGGRTRVRRGAAGCSPRPPRPTRARSSSTADTRDLLRARSPERDPLRRRARAPAVGPDDARQTLALFVRDWCALISRTDATAVAREPRSRDRRRRRRSSAVRRANGSRPSIARAIAQAWFQRNGGPQHRRQRAQERAVGVDAPSRSARGCRSPWASASRSRGRGGRRRRRPRRRAAARGA
jgi:hypothetical protein